MKADTWFIPLLLACLIAATQQAHTHQAEFLMKVTSDGLTMVEKPVLLYKASDPSVAIRVGSSTASSNDGYNFRCDIDDSPFGVEEPTEQFPGVAQWRVIKPGTYILRIENWKCQLAIHLNNGNERDFYMLFNGNMYDEDRRGFSLTNGAPERVVLSSNGPWIAQTTVLVTTDQKLSDNSTAGDIYHLFSDGFEILSNYTSQTVNVTINSVQTLRADRHIISGEKYNNWNDAPEVENHHRFLIGSQPLSITSHFKPIDGSATIQAQFIEDPASTVAMIEFKDPWFVDSTDTRYEDALFNRANDALHRSRSSPFRPNMSDAYEYGMRYDGVFLNQGYEWNPPFYSIGSQVPEGSYPKVFAGWQGTNAVFQDTNSLRTGVIFTNSNAQATAMWKAHLGSSISAATASNGQRKIGYIGLKYHLVYESAGDVWYVSSSDNGANWSSEVRLSDGTGRSRQPSLAINQTYLQRDSQNPDGDLYRIGCVWEYVDGEISSIEVRRSDGKGTWTTEEALTAFMVPVAGGSTPVMTMENECETIVWKGAYAGGDQGLFLRVLVPTSEPISYYTFFDNDLIPGTSSSSLHPTSATIAYDGLSGEFAVAWSQAGEIYYKRCQVDFQGWTVNFLSTEWASQGHSSSYTAHDYPSLVFEQNATVRPVCAWQAHFHNEAVDYECVLTRRRESPGGRGRCLPSTASTEKMPRSLPSCGQPTPPPI